MNVIVTGGAGFLGSHLTEALLQRGHDVLVIDNMMTGRKRNLDAAKKQYGDKLQLLTDDIIEIEQAWWWKDRSYNAIFNFACPASPPAYQRDPIHTMMTCVVGTKNMLDIARRDGAIFVQASTSEIYGDPDVHPQVESYKGCVNTLGPRACYDEGKRAAETLCMDYQRLYGVDVKIARIFNTYGPRMDPNDGRVVSNFICQALRGEKLTIYGDGSQTRSFCYVDDLIDGFMKLFHSGPEFHGPVNLGNPNEFTMTELATEIIHIIYGGRNVAWREVARWLDYKSLPQDDPRQRCPDITLALEKLSWSPKVSLDDGLKEAIKYFREEIK